MKNYFLFYFLYIEIYMYIEILQLLTRYIIRHYHKRILLYELNTRGRFTR